jgi:pyrimidine-specific ribonucleoside hydrolase
MERNILLTSLFIFIAVFSSAGSGTHSTQVMIDTDAGMDDMRALCLILAAEDIQVLGITTSDGMCDPLTGYGKVKSLLQFLGHEGIPVKAGRRLPEKTDPYGDICYSLRWGTGPVSQAPAGDAEQFLVHIFTILPEEITLVALGPLSNYARALGEDPSLASRIDRIIWYNDNINPLKGDNYSFDKDSYATILNLKVPIEIISNTRNDELVFDSTFLNAADHISSRYADAISLAFHDSIINDKLNRGHLGLWDDLVSLYLLFPEDFSLSQSDEATLTKQYIPKSIETMNHRFLELLNQGHDASQVFKLFPSDPLLFADDVGAIMEEIIQKHGLEEWKAGVITNELHGHLGAYAIIGTKMGLRAKDYFHAGHDQMEIISHAGSAPPLSCMNDGLQASTGATLGHGLIQVRTGLETEPVAKFSYRNNWIEIQLKEIYRQIISEDISSAIRLYGNLTDEYWLYIRQIALKYWLEWDRYELFIINELR